MPISGTSLDKVWTAIKRQLRLPRMSWHVLRHTWAEETADGLLDKYISSADVSEICLAILRELGGWTYRSSTPFHYIRNAIHKRGMQYQMERNAHFDNIKRNKK
jgi:hypothetical protein